MSEDTVFHSSDIERPTHYHGDFVRGLFVTCAVLVFLTQFIGSKLPFTSVTVMLIVLILVIAAGITNPAQHWIHWANLIIAIGGVLIFGGLAIARLSTVAQLFSGEGVVALLAILFLASLYFATRTLRGLMVPHIDISEIGEQES